MSLSTVTQRGVKRVYNLMRDLRLCRCRCWSAFARSCWIGAVPGCR